MIAPYNCVGLIPTVWGIRTRADIMKNIEHLGHLTKAAAWLSRLDIPVRLLVIPEGGLQGFNDEVLDLDHVEFANTCAIDIPGPETQRWASSRASTMFSSWRRPRRSIRTGRIASSMSASCSTPRARSSSSTTSWRRSIRSSTA